MHGLNNMNFHLLSLIRLQPLLNAQSDSIETNAESPIWHHSLSGGVGVGCDPAIQYQINCMEPLPSWKEKCFVHTGINT